jgi:ABC-2 type transport system ATP-binding protein
MPEDYRNQVAELAAIVGLGDEVFEPVRTYSGGMSRKLEIVRSLIHRPKVLFLDEPTSGLDAPARRSLWTYLDRVRREANTTILLTTHYLEEAEQADRICIIDHGRVVSHGTPAAIKADLVEEYVLVDTADRAALVSELGRLGLPYSGDGPYRVELDGRGTHAVLKSIDTPLDMIRTHAPSLEDAYLEIVSRTDPEAEPPTDA